VNKYTGTTLAQSATPEEIQKADLDLLTKINEVNDGLEKTTLDVDGVTKVLTPDTLAALAGTSGTPSATNPFVTKLGANPFCIWNSESTINTNGVVSKTVVSDMNGAGATLLSITANTYYDMTVPYMINMSPFLQLRSKIDGNWINVEEAYIPSIFTKINMTAWYVSTEISGLLLAKVSSGVLRVYISNRLVGGTDYGYSGAPVARTWSAAISAADGFDAWRVCYKG